MQLPWPGRRAVRSFCRRAFHRTIPAALPLLALSTLPAASALAASAKAGRTIVYSARYYLKPGSKGTSRYHLYTIRPDGSGKKTLTGGAHDDWGPSISPDGRRIAFVRDDRWVCTIKPGGSGLKRLYDNAETGFYNLRWSPDGKTLGYITTRNAVSGILFVDSTSGKTRWQRDANYFEWSPDGRRLAIESNNYRVRLLELATHRETQLPQGTVRPAWLSNSEVVTIVSHLEDDFPHFDKFAIYATNGSLRRQLPIKAKGGEYSDTDSIDPRSRLKRIPGTSSAFVFVWDDSTSSGPNALFHHIDAKTGISRHLADGQSFAFAPSGTRFVFSPYYELTPYDKHPDGRTRVVYTSPLIVSDGKKQHKIVSGMVLISGCDWR